MFQILSTSSMYILFYEHIEAQPGILDLLLSCILNAFVSVFVILCATNKVAPNHVALAQS